MDDSNGSHPPELQAIFDELHLGKPFASLEEAQLEIARRVDEYNSRQQAELGGLSPAEMQMLLSGDWITTGAMWMNVRLSLGDLSGAAVLTDARTILEYVHDHGPVKVTAAHYLPTAVVAALLPKLLMPKVPHLAHNHVFSPPKREGEVPWLPELRFVLMVAKLLVYRKGVRVTRLGRQVLAPDRAGALYAFLFISFFRQLDLSVLDGAPPNRALQGTIAYSFRALRTQARDWAAGPALARTAWLESAKDPVPESERWHSDLRYIPFQLRVLEPLVEFGLLDARPTPGVGHRLKMMEYRCTPLYARFLHFEF